MIHKMPSTPTGVKHSGFYCCLCICHTSDHICVDQCLQSLHNWTLEYAFIFDKRASKDALQLYYNILSMWLSTDYSCCWSLVPTVSVIWWRLDLRFILTQHTNSWCLTIFAWRLSHRSKFRHDISHCSCRNTSQFIASKSLLSFPYAVLIQNQNADLLNIFIHATEHDLCLYVYLLIATCSAPGHHARGIHFALLNG